MGGSEMDRMADAPKWVLESPYHHQEKQLFENPHNVRNVGEMHDNVEIYYDPSQNYEQISQSFTYFAYLWCPPKDIAWTDKIDNISKDVELPIWLLQLGI